MKVLLVITGLGVGGAERLVTALADCYAAVGHEVMLVRFHGEAELRPGDPRVRLENLDMRRSPLGLLVAMRRFRRLILEFRPDVVNSHLVHANVLTRMLRLVTPIPFLVSSAHNNNEGGRFRMLAYRLTDRLADISTNVSEDAVQVFEKQRALLPGRMLAIHNGINTEDFVYDQAARGRIRAELSVSDRTPLIVSVGRLWQAKDYPNLLNAVSGLAQKSVEFRLAIVGDGPLRSDLKALAQSLGIAGHVDFLGVRHDIPALMSACDVFVLSSAWEGFGLVVAEAMACERVVVATDSGGVKEVVGEAGYLVRPRDSEALFRGIDQALRLSDAECKTMGKVARKRVVEKFSLATTADRYLAVYRGEMTYNILEGSQ
ncbi:glycosyltransferase involved in cell wall biosynthesis [Marinobacter pelagius]|uniref:Glycosyltransferase involved in cell wall biosynthesis n=1 Tax=Marinobacter pelagius TaxID=379482 RepID=A0A366GDJ5_9GAMM|nr:glycosyltransferase [Marinobacter pelagius]RBP25014.1 glycosyltransferase involved in cell wall biosynthesis [Marinobacter pelagius]